MGIDEEAKKYWNDMADFAEFSTPLQIDLFKEYVDTKSCILDYGCGYGRTLNELETNGYKCLFGVDFSAKMIDRGREKYPGLNLIVNHGNEIPFEADIFDVVILLSVFTCNYRDEEQNRIMQEVKRVLKPEGLIYINDFLINTDERYVQRYDMFKDAYGQYGIFELRGTSGATILRHHSIERITEMTGSFKPIAFERLTYTTMYGNKSNGFYYLGKNLK